jgi:hypothetical protein
MKDNNLYDDGAQSLDYEVMESEAGQPGNYEAHVVIDAPQEMSIQD